MSNSLLIRRLLTCLLLPVLITGTASAQGKVVINEYMPWTPSACGASAEFIELLNFGPGPVNIGCYILTDGDYSVSIPANTILQPGEFYVISGMDSIPFPCANIDSAIHTDLNWTTCNCTSAPIPTTGDGFMTDGGSANEQLVLLDPALNIVDAVVRSIPVEASSLITTSTAGGNCLPQVFDLDLMTINYETIGESAGRGNSFARRLDGDCGWVKDPQQSGNATNNTPGDVSDVSYSFQYINSTGCPDNGSIRVTVHATNYGTVFPMSYTLAFDADADGIFETTDTYTNGTVTNPNTISISNLVPGMYRLTVASVKGCYLHTFPFFILDCQDVLAIRLLDFSVQKKAGYLHCSWVMEKITDLVSVMIERSADGIHFSEWATVPAAAIPAQATWNYTHRTPEENTTLNYFRLALKDKRGVITHSRIEKINELSSTVFRVWPNPVADILYIQPGTAPGEKLEIEIYSNTGVRIKKEETGVAAFNGLIRINIRSLSRGVYRLVIRTADRVNTGFFRFLKL